MVQIFSTMVLTCGTKFDTQYTFVPNTPSFFRRCLDCILLEIHNCSYSLCIVYYHRRVPCHHTFRKPCGIFLLPFGFGEPGRIAPTSTSALGCGRSACCWPLSRALWQSPSACRPLMRSASASIRSVPCHHPTWGQGVFTCPIYALRKECSAAHHGPDQPLVSSPPAFTHVQIHRCMP
jgi:hypothetical protein